MIKNVELHFGWSQKLKDSISNHVAFNLKTWSRQIGPKWIRKKHKYAFTIA